MTPPPSARRPKSSVLRLTSMMFLLTGILFLLAAMSQWHSEMSGLTGQGHGTEAFFASAIGIAECAAAYGIRRRRRWGAALGICAWVVLLVGGMNAGDSLSASPTSSMFLRALPWICLAALPVLLPLLAWRELD